MKNLIAFFILLISFVSLAQDKTSPTATGAYYQTSSGYTRLELATSSGFKTGGMGKAMLSYGIAKIKGKWLYRNPSATVQMADRHPVFTLISQIDISTQAVAFARLYALWRLAVTITEHHCCGRHISQISDAQETKTPSRPLLPCQDPAGGGYNGLLLSDYL